MTTARPGASQPEGDTMSGIGDFAEKAKDLLGDNADQAGDLLDTAAAAIKERTPDSMDGAIDQAVDKAKDALEAEKDR